MGKTVKKNQTARVRRTASSGAFVVRGKRFELSECNPKAIAEYLRGKGYPAGTMVKYRGGAFEMTRDDVAGDFKLVRVA